jgi:hypothetical protein
VDETLTTPSAIKTVFYKSFNNKLAGLISLTKKSINLFVKDSSTWTSTQLVSNSEEIYDFVFDSDFSRLAFIAVTAAASTVPSHVFLYDLKTNQKMWDLAGMNSLKIDIIPNDGFVVVGFFKYVDGISDMSSLRFIDIATGTSVYSPALTGTKEFGSKKVTAIDVSPNAEGVAVGFDSDYPIYFQFKCDVSCTSSSKACATPAESVCCDSKCKTCYGGTSDTCSSCNSPDWFWKTSGTCTASCPDGSYAADSVNKICEDCNTECLTCTGALRTNCATCDATSLTNSWLFDDENSCNPSCPSTRYVKTLSPKTCSVCHSSCLSCSGPLANECLTCDKNNNNFDWYWVERKTCYSDCPDGSYQFSVTDKKCSSCHSECSTCDGGNNNNCLSCDPLNCEFNNYWAAKKTCYADCPSGSFSSGENLCSTCNGACLTCDGPNNSDCLSCNKLNSDHAYYWSTTKICYSVCPTGTYASDLTNNLCSICDQTCLACTGTPTNCVYDGIIKVLFIKFIIYHKAIFLGHQLPLEITVEKSVCFHRNFRNSQNTYQF